MSIECRLTVIFVSFIVCPKANPRDFCDNILNFSLISSVLYIWSFATLLWNLQIQFYKHILHLNQQIIFPTFYDSFQNLSMWWFQCKNRQHVQEWRYERQNVRVRIRWHDDKNECLLEEPYSDRHVFGHHVKRLYMWT